MIYFILSFIVTFGIVVAIDLVVNQAMKQSRMRMYRKLTAINSRDRMKASTLREIKRQKDLDKQRAFSKSQQYPSDFLSIVSDPGSK